MCCYPGDKARPGGILNIVRLNPSYEILYPKGKANLTLLGGTLKAPNILYEYVPLYKNEEDERYPEVRLYVSTHFGV